MKSIRSNRGRASLMSKKLSITLISLFSLLAVTLSGSARADRLRDLADIKGARDNQLIGYGVVTGLSGTGDDITAPLAVQSILSMLRRLGVQVDKRQLRLRNIAAVIVTANIPAFAKPGTKLDVTVSSVGNAKSLKGGVLVQTVLKGADRKSYAVAQGNLVIGGFTARGRSGSKVKSGSTTAGRIPSGAIIERAIKTKFVFNGTLQLSLRTPSFALASRIAKAIDENLGDGTARAPDGGSVVVKLPKEFRTKPVDLIATLQELDVQPDRKARVVVNERTQTIVAGGDVRLSAAAVVHGNLTIVVREQPAVSQPVAPLTPGTTQVVQQSDVEVQEQGSSVHYMQGAATLADLTSALNALGLSARELISVLQALKTAQVLEAELVVQ